MYQIGDIFYEDQDYSTRVEFCNNNGLIIKEIDKDAKGRRFQIQKMPAPSASEIANMQIREKKALLRKYKEDIEQVLLFKMEREDFEEKRKLCSDIIVELRRLEQLAK